MSKNVSLEANSDDAAVVQCVTNYFNESETASRDRKLQNLQNFDTYHLRQDLTHKKKGQSKEFLPKQFMAVEQITSFVQQGIADLGSEWYSLEQLDGVEDPKIDKETIKALLDRHLTAADIYTNTGDALKCGLLGSLMVTKIDGEWVDKPRYMTKKYKEAGKEKVELMRTKERAWRLKLSSVSYYNLHIDPSGRGLYIMEDIEMDIHQIKALVKSKSNPNGIYDAAAVELLQGDMVNTYKEWLRARETGQNVSMSAYRHRVTVRECWGDIIDSDGNIIYHNVVCAVANEKFLIRKPQQNPFWHQEHPYIITPIIRVPNSVWHQALMDAPTKLNIAANEVFNLALDQGMMAAFGIKQLRPDWLQDPTQVDDGIAPGQTLEVNSSCPPGQPVLERVDTAMLSPEVLQIYNLVNAEHQQSAMTNDLRLGVLPQRQVKATEIVESSQSITGMLNGVAKLLETKYMQPLLAKSWMTVAQHIDDLDSAEVKKLLGPKKAAILATLSQEEIFAETVNGLTFNVFGLTNTLNKMKDFRRLTSLLQTIGSVEPLVDAFAQEYSFPKFLGEIIKSLDINTDKIKLDDKEKTTVAQAAQAQGGAPSPAGTPATPGSGGPNAMSQIPQVASNASGPIAQPKFPPSPVSNL